MKVRFLPRSPSNHLQSLQSTLQSIQSQTHNSDWVFASDRVHGKKPRSACSASKDYLRPAAVKAGVIPEDYKGRFGWHNLRHSLASFFAHNDVDLPVIQAALRHAKPTSTAKYIHRSNAVQIKAQSKFLEAIKVAKSASAS